MIRINCVKCRATLEIDDGFAGGVCRCIHCAAMQSVPKRAKPGLRTAAPTESRALYSPPSRVGATAGLLDPSSIAGSDLSGSGLGGSGGGLGSPAVPSANRPGAAGAKVRSPLRYVLFGAVAVVVVLAGVVLRLINGGSGEKSTSAFNAPAATDPVAGKAVRPEPAGEFNPSAARVGAADPINTPTFCGLPLKEPSLIYLIDRGGMSTDVLAATRQALTRSIDSLHPNQTFQIILWDSDREGTPIEIPPTGPTAATADAFAAAVTDLGNVDQHGSTLIESGQPPAGAAIAQPDFSAKYFSAAEDFTNNAGPPGQTFTPQTDLLLRAITVKGFADNAKSFGQGPYGKVTLTVSRVDDGNVLYQLSQESARGGFTKGNAYQTFTLAKPVPLKSGQRYAYDIFTQGGFYGFAKSSSKVYPGGSAMQHGSTAHAAPNGAAITHPQQVDRTFFINPGSSFNGNQPPLERALAQRPALIVVVSAKPEDEAFATRALSTVNIGQTQFDVIHIGDPPAPPVPATAMRRVAIQSGGQYRDITPEELKSIGK